MTTAPAPVSSRAQTRAAERPEKMLWVTEQGDCATLRGVAELGKATREM